MKTEITLNLRVFPVTVQDLRTGEKLSDTITLEKSQAKACQLVGQCVTDLIYRIYNRKGYRVLEVGKSHKLPFTVDLSIVSDHFRFSGSGTDVLEAEE